MMKENKGLKIAVISLASAVVVALILFFAINASSSSYKTVAEQYDRAVRDGRYEDAYKYLDVEDSVFLTETEYLTRQSILGDVLNSYDISSLVEKVAEKGFNMIISKLINIQYEVVESKDQDGKASVTFMRKPIFDTYGVLSEMTTIALIKDDTNTMLFFPDWRVDDQKVIVHDITLEIPKYTSAYIDGIAIPASYMESENGDKLIYHIPGLYTGDHVCSLSNDGYNFNTFSFITDRSNSTVRIEEFEATVEDQQAVIDKAYEAFRAITEAEVRGAEFGEIRGYFTNDSIAAEREKYNQAKEYFLTTAKTSGIDSVDVKDVVASIYGASFVDGTMEVTVSLEYKDTNTGKIDPYIAAIIGKDSGVDADNRMTQTIRMRYEDGNWKVSSTGSRSVADNCWFF